MTDNRPPLPGSDYFHPDVLDQGVDGLQATMVVLSQPHVEDLEDMLDKLTRDHFMLHFLGMHAGPAHDSILEAIDRVEAAITRATLQAVWN